MVLETGNPKCDKRDANSPKRSTVLFSGQVGPVTPNVIRDRAELPFRRHTDETCKAEVCTLRRQTCRSHRHADELKPAGELARSLNGAPIPEHRFHLEASPHVRFISRLTKPNFPSKPRPRLASTVRSSVSSVRPPRRTLEAAVLLEARTCATSCGTERRPPPCNNGHLR